MPRKKGVVYPKLDADKAMKLYSNGLPDGEIAKACGVTREAVGDWRKRMGLPRNPETRKKRTPAWLVKIADQNAEARAAGLTYGQHMAVRGSV